MIAGAQDWLCLPIPLGAEVPAAWAPALGLMVPAVVLSSHCGVLGVGEEAWLEPTDYLLGGWTGLSREGLWAPS